MKKIGVFFSLWTSVVPVDTNKLEQSVSDSFVLVLSITLIVVGILLIIKSIRKPAREEGDSKSIEVEGSSETKGSSETIGVRVKFREGTSYLVDCPRVIICPICFDFVDPSAYLISKHLKKHYKKKEELNLFVRQQA